MANEAVLHSEDAISITNAQRLFEKSNLETNLIYIKANFGFLSTEITRLETKGLLLTESLKIIQNVEESLENVPNHVREIIKNKMKGVLSKKQDIKIILKIAEILDENETSIDSLPVELTADKCVHFKYAPITSVDVERSFSAYKNVLSDNRRKFLFENLKKTLIIQVNSESL